jgi:hypothetical protein
MKLNIQIISSTPIAFQIQQKQGKMNAYKNI